MSPGLVVGAGLGLTARAVAGGRGGALPRAEHLSLAHSARVSIPSQTTAAAHAAIQATAARSARR
jgi:hypothetical protein